MASKVEEKVDDSFWKEFPKMTDYFSPAIAPLLGYLGMDTKHVMYDFGEQIGRKAAAKMAYLSIPQMLEEFSRVWEAYGIGTLSVVGTKPLTLQVSNCTVCGQLSGTGEMYECTFHEGFFQGALSARMGRTVSLKQDTNYEGEAGTWCRRLATDVEI